MDCVTPSQPVPIPHGVSQIIEETLTSTNGGTLHADGRPMTEEPKPAAEVLAAGQVAVAPSAITYRRQGFEEILFLEAQNATSREALAEVMKQRNESDPSFDWGMGTTSAAQHIPPTLQTKKKTKTGGAASPDARLAKRVGPITSLPVRRAPETSA